MTAISNVLMSVCGMNAVWLAACAHAHLNVSATLEMGCCFANRIINGEFIEADGIING